MGKARSTAAIYGCAGLELGVDEKAFFTDANPAGFILFARNCQSPAQLKKLVNDLRDCIGSGTAPILIDQEGGRVVRMKPPHWRHPPAAARFAELADINMEIAKEAANLNAMLIGHDLLECGINVDCLPVLDVPQKNADPIIGDRALGMDPRQIAELGRAVCDGLLAGGVLPVVKHIPGHGRAEVDSHILLPVVDTPRDELHQTDFAPFAKLADMPMAMTAHVVYRAVDAEHPATSSATVIKDIIRDEIGFDGFLITDDLCMKALSGGYGERTTSALDAGCDVVLHCSGDMLEMKEVATAVPEMTDAAEQHLQDALGRLHEPEEFDRDGALDRLNKLIGNLPS